MFSVQRHPRACMAQQPLPRVQPPRRRGLQSGTSIILIPSTSDILLHIFKHIFGHIFTHTHSRNARCCRTALSRASARATRSRRPKKASARSSASTGSSRAAMGSSGGGICGCRSMGSRILSPSFHFSASGFRVCAAQSALRVVFTGALMIHLRYKDCVNGVDCLCLVFYNL